MEVVKKLLEKDIQKAVLDYLRIKGYFVWKQNNSGIMKPNGSYIPSQMKGIADINGIGPKGKYMAIEVKRPGGKLTFEQERFLMQVREKGGLAGVVHSVDHIVELIAKWEDQLN